VDQAHLTRQVEESRPSIGLTLVADQGRYQQLGYRPAAVS
jgi:hypothetical protein